MIEENKQPEIDLASKYLAGEATPEEAMWLHELLNKRETKEEYDKVVQLWNSLPNGNLAEVPKAEEEWIMLQTKIADSDKGKMRRLPLCRLGVAASIAGVIMILSYVLLFKNSRTELAITNNAVNTIQSRIAVRTDTLLDGSIITMNKNSSLAYSGDFNVKSRETELKGEAYFDVVHDKTKPFIISVSKLKVRVVGTSFNVRNIAGSNTIEVQVRSGVVKMYTEHKKITVVKSQTGIYSKSNGDLVLKDTVDFNSMSYATKSFSFNDISLFEACRYLEKAFNVIIRIDEEKFADCRLTAQFNNKPLDYILQVISATLNSNYKKQGNTIYITGEGCK